MILISVPLSIKSFSSMGPVVKANLVLKYSIVFTLSNVSIILTPILSISMNREFIFGSSVETRRLRKNLFVFFQDRATANRGRFAGAILNTYNMIGITENYFCKTHIF